MPLVVGVNTWITTAQADDILTYNPFAQGWFSLDDTQGTPGTPSKESHLAYACQWIKSVTKNKAPDDTTDENLMNAQALLALHVIRTGNPSNSPAEKSRMGMFSYRLGNKAENFNYLVEKDGSASMPQEVLGLLKDYLPKPGAVVFMGRGGKP